MSLKGLFQAFLFVGSAMALGALAGARAGVLFPHYILQGLTVFVFTGVFLMATSPIAANFGYHGKKAILAPYEIAMFRCWDGSQRVGCCPAAVVPLKAITSPPGSHHVVVPRQPACVCPCLKALLPGRSSRSQGGGRPPTGLCRETRRA